MVRKLLKALTFAASGLFLALHCTAPNGGTGSQAPNSNISGVIYNANGSPAANATVHFYPVSYNPYTKSLGKTKALAAAAAVSTLDSTRTDATGHYNVNLDSGSYNLLASGDSGQAFQDSIATVKGSTIHPTDTLRAPGSICGIIQMAGGGNPETVFIIFMGTGSVWFPADTFGNFATGNMAPGRYPVRFLTTTPNYNVLDTTLTVTAGKIDTLAAPIQLQFNGIPVPQGLHIQYDSLKEIATLTWNKPTTGTKVASYNVYREQSDSTNYGLIKGGLADTTYQDSSGVQGNTYYYRVTAVDTNSNEGGKSGAESVTFLSAFSIKGSLFNIGGYGWLYAVEKDPHGNYVILNGTAFYPNPAEMERFSPSGLLINSWNLPGGVEETYVYDCIAVGDSNTIFDISKGNIVIRYDTTGTILSQFQYPGTASGIGILNDTIYIGDRTAHIVRAYSIAGDSLFSWGAQGSGPSQFGSIGSLRTDSITGNIFIEDGQGDYSRLQIFDRNGNYKSSFSFQASGQGLVGGYLAERNDTILASGSSLGAFTMNGTFIFRYTFGLSSMFKKAIFDNSKDNFVIFNWTGEVMNLVRK